MESHPLNVAHQQHRMAVAYLVKNRFHEAIQCHLYAADLLLDAMTLTTSTIAIECMSMQHKYHLKQRDLIQSKREQYSRVKRSIENIEQGTDPLLDVSPQDCTNLQRAISSTMTETDNLLNVLVSNSAQGEVEGTVSVQGSHVEEMQQKIIEDLHALSQNSHILMKRFLQHVEAIKDENTILNEKVIFLEKEREKYLNLMVLKKLMKEDIDNSEGCPVSGVKDLKV